MKNQLIIIKDEALKKISEAKTLDQVEEIRILYLSKKGEVSLLMSKLRDLPQEERPQFGALVNETKQVIEEALYNKKHELENEALLKLLETEKIDVTLPGYQFYKGNIHPLNQVIEDVEDLFIGLGYEVAEGPELENDHYNFEMMNLEKDHSTCDARFFLY